MSRKTYAFVLIVLVLAFTLTPGVHAKSPIDNVEIVQDLPENIVAGSTYEMIITFDNVAEESVPLIVEITVTCEEAPLGYDEIIVKEVKLNNDILDCTEEDPGFFRTEEGTLKAESSNELSITVSSLVNLMPGTYTFEIDLLGEEIEPEPEPSGGRPNKKPVADAGINQTVYVGELVAFNGSGSYDPDGWIRSWSWSFGDGETASGEVTNHTYTVPGIYTVTLTVKDSRSAKASDTCIVTVIEEAEPTPPKPAKFILSDLSITPERSEPGDEVTIIFTVTNVGEETGTYTTNLTVGDESITMVVTLRGGETEEMEIKLFPEEEGTYQVEVNGLIGDIVVETPPTPPKPAEFVLTNFNYTSELIVGEPLRIYIDITNVGELPGETTIAIKIDGVVQSALQSLFQLGPGDATSQVWTTYEYYGPGTHTIELDGFDGRFSAISPPPTPPHRQLIWGLLVTALCIVIYILYKFVYTPRMNTIHWKYNDVQTRGDETS